MPLPRPEVVTPSRVVDKPRDSTNPSRSPSQKRRRPTPNRFPNSPRKSSRATSRGLRRLLEDNHAAAAKRRALRARRLAFGSVLASLSRRPQFDLAARNRRRIGFYRPGGGGDFGGRFSWYVDAVRNRVSSNWLQSTVDPSVRFAPRAVVTFDILRNGSVTNVQILQSSGNASVDNSAVRAILGSNPLNPLPGEYSGSKVSVEFWFDFKR